MKEKVVFKRGDITKNSKGVQFEVLLKVPFKDDIYSCKRISDGQIINGNGKDLIMVKAKNPDSKESSNNKIFGFIILGLLAIFLIPNMLYTIDAGERGVLLTFGEANSVSREPGIHFKIPLAQQVVKMEVRTIKFKAPSSGASKDLQVVSTTVEPNFHIDPDRVAELYSDVGLGYAERVIYPVVQEIVKASTALFTAEELITKRPEVKLKIEEGIRVNLAKRGIILEQVSITNFDFSDSFNLAIEEKVKAEQLKLTAERDLERIKIEALQTEAEALGNKNAKILNAQADNEAKILNAQADNEAKILNAQAEALGIEIIQEKLDKSPKYIDWLKVTTWDGVLPKVTGDVIPMIDITGEVGN